MGGTMVCRMVYITSIKIAQASSDGPTFAIILKAGVVKYQPYVQDASGKNGVMPTMFTWNQLKNTDSFTTRKMLKS